MGSLNMGVLERQGLMPVMGSQAQLLQPRMGPSRWFATDPTPPMLHKSLPQPGGYAGGGGPQRGQRLPSAGLPLPQQGPAASLLGPAPEAVWSSLGEGWEAS